MSLPYINYYVYMLCSKVLIIDVSHVSYICILLIVSILLC